MLYTIFNELMNTTKKKKRRTPNFFGNKTFWIKNILALTVSEISSHLSLDQTYFSQISQSILFLFLAIFNQDICQKFYPFLRIFQLTATDSFIIDYNLTKKSLNDVITAKLIETFNSH